MELESQPLTFHVTLRLTISKFSQLFLLSAKNVLFVVLFTTKKNHGISLFNHHYS